MSVLALLAASCVLARPAAAAPVDVSTAALSAAIRVIEGFDPPFGSAVADDPARVALGKKLFSDPRLSKGGVMSCATCHQPARFFTDGRARPLDRFGKPLPRNVPSLVNVEVNGSFTRTRRFFWDGRAGRLDEAIESVLENPREFARAPDAAVKSQAEVLAAYVRSLAPDRPSPYERLHRDWGALSAAQKRGLILFTGKARCVNCHWNADFSSGEIMPTGIKGDAERVRVPSLRNAALTAPYMHDGSLATLSDVIEFYDRGGHSSAPDARLGLTPREKKDLEAFLYALNSPPASGAAPAALEDAPGEEAPAAYVPPPPPGPKPEDEAPAGAWTGRPEYSGRECERRFSPEALTADLAAGRFDPAEFSYLRKRVLGDLLSYYRYRAWQAGDDGPCAALDYSAYSEEKYARAVYCREWLADVRLWRAVATRDPAVGPLCRERARPELCAALEESREDPPSACGKLPPSIVSLPWKRPCETFLGAIAGRPLDCSAYERSLTGEERCRTVTSFARAWAKKDLGACGGYEPCEVLMGQAPAVLDRVTRRMKDAVCAGGAGRVVEMRPVE